MPVSLITLGFKTITVTGDAIQQADIPEDGSIVAVDWTLHAVGTGGTFSADDSASLQLSFLATSQFATAESRGIISHIGLAVSQLTTSGMAMASIAKFCAFPEPLDVAGGERIFVHFEEGGQVSIQGYATVHLKVGRTRTRRSARRR